MRHLLPLTFLLALLVAPVITQADILTWDGDTSLSGQQDGSGTWNTTATDRWFNPLTPGYQTWNNATPDSAIFGNGIAGTYTVTLGEAITVEDITFRDAGYTIAGGGNPLTLASGSVITTTANATLSLGLAGTNGFTKEGTGNLTLGGGATANTLTGATIINAGTLTMGKNNGVNAIAGDITLNGGTLAWGASNQIADAASITVTGGTLTFNGRDETFANYTQTGGTGIPNGSNSGIVTLTGTLAISGGTGMTINSNGQWSANAVDFSGFTTAGDVLLMGANGVDRLTTFTVGSGGLTLTGQTIAQNAANGPGANGAVIFLNGDVTASGANTIRVNGTPSTAENKLDLGAANRVFNIVDSAAPNDTTTLFGALTVVGTGGLTKTGGGTLVLNTTTDGNLISVGTITVQEGTLTWNTSNQINDATAMVVNGGTINFNGQNETFASYNQSSGAGISSGNNGAVTITGAATISGGGTFTVNSGGHTSVGTLDFTGFSGNALLMGGGTAGVTQVTTLTIGSGGLILTGQTLTMNRATTAGFLGSEIRLNGNVTASGANTFAFNSPGNPVAGAVGQINHGTDARTWNITADTTTVNLAIVGDGGLTKTGAGTLSLTGVNANTYTGRTTVSAGVLSLSKTAGTNAIAGDILINGGTLQWATSANNEQLANTSSITLASGTLNFNSRSETLNNLTKTGGTTTTSSNGNITFLGTLAVSGGTSNGADGAGWTVNSGGTHTANSVDFHGFINASNGNRALNVGGNNASVITTFAVGAGGLFLDGQSLQFNHGSAGNKGSQLLLNGDVTASGTNIFSSVASAVSGSVTQIDMGTTGTRTWNITSGTTNLTTNMALIGSASLTKTGGGILRFDGVTSYTGKTTVAAGKLTLAAGGRIDSSPWIQVDSGATLDVSAISGGYSYASTGTGVISGSGTIQGSLNIGAGKVLKPGSTSNPANVNTAGDGVGTLTVTSNLTFNPTAPSTVAEFKIQSPSSSDEIVIGGSLTLDGNSNMVVTFDDANPFIQAFGQSWTLMDWVGTLTATGFNTGANFRTGNNADGNEGNLDLPELSTGLFWQVENFSGSGSLTISIVPEPGKALLLTCGVMGMCLRRRRR